MSCCQMETVLKALMTERELLKFLEEHGGCSGVSKTAAICAFVLAKRAQKADNSYLATDYGRKCLELLAKCPQEIVDCAHPYITISGVLIPERFHEGTVRQALAPLIL